MQTTRIQSRSRLQQSDDRSLGLPLGVLLLLMLAVPAVAQTITVFDPPHSIHTSPRGINANGEITGSFFDSVTGTTRGFIRAADGQFTVFDGPVLDAINIRDINTGGTVTGYSGSGGFVRTPDGQVTQILFAANALNDPGQIVGDGYLRSPTGALTVITAPNDTTGSTNIEDINNAGESTGEFHDGVTNTNRMFVRSATGQFTVFDPPNGDGTDVDPEHINHSGQVAGCSTT